MGSPDEDRILYVDQDDEPAVIHPGPLAMRLAALALVAGMVYLAFGQLALRPNGGAPAASANAIPELATGFDASSGDFTACDHMRNAVPDFSIVVAGTEADDGQQVVSRVVQFVVVNTYYDHRYGRDRRAQSLCTLP
jgi:hypothetical protein